MDIIAHFLWTFALFWNYRKRVVAAFFGIFPDLLSSGLWMLFLFVTGSFALLDFPVNHGGGALQKLGALPGIDTLYFLYNISHSIIIFLFVFFVIYAITKKTYLFLFGWLLHILIDIPSHTKAFFPTPIFYPISDFTFSGISWANKWFMIINYSALALVYVYLLFFYKKKKHKK